MRKKLIYAAVVAGVILGSAVAAEAVTGFDVTGTAKASGTVGSVVPTTGSGTLVNFVYPGQSDDCDITFTNTNPVDVVITDISGQGYVVTSGPGAGQSGGTPAAPESSFPAGTINHVSGLSITVPKNGTKEAVITGCVTASNDIPNDAQGSTFTLHFATDGHTA